ncbi:MAG: hypothetical protein ACU84Q_14030 [Gammaproteobacteria bacterium]
MQAIKLRLTGFNRSVVLGLSDFDEMLQLAKLADEATAWDSVWPGNSIIAKPRLDVMAALDGLSAVTSRVKLGVGRMASALLRDPLLMTCRWDEL